MRIALLEHDQAQSDQVLAWLQAAGHSCHAFVLGKDLVRAAQRETFDMFLLDWEVPGMSGAQVLDYIRAKILEPIPVLCVTARTGEEEIVRALSRGADDFMVKPLRKLELLARIGVLARRARPGHELEVLRYGRLLIDTHGRQVTWDGAVVAMTQKDYELAVFLLRNVGRLLSRGHILEAVWGQSAKLKTRTVDTHISRIRRKLQLTPENGWRLSAVYHRGYCLERVTGTAVK